MIDKFLTAYSKIAISYCPKLSDLFKFLFVFSIHNLSIRDNFDSPRNQLLLTICYYLFVTIRLYIKIQYTSKLYYQFKEMSFYVRHFP